MFIFSEVMFLLVLLLFLHNFCYAEIEENHCTEPKLCTNHYEPLVNFSSTRGRQLLKEALDTDYANSFFKVISNYRTQEKRAFCGLSTIAFSLNILQVDQFYKEPYRFQEEQLAGCPTADVVGKSGMVLSQFRCLAELNGLDISVVYARNADQLDNFRATIKEITISPDGSSVLVVNYNRVRFGFLFGHFSPVAAYHEASDKVLVAEVARYEFEPQWLDLSLLWLAMMDIDSDSGTNRGYCILRARTPRPLPVTQVKLASESEQFQDAMKQWKEFADAAVDTDIGRVLTELKSIFSGVNFCCSEKDFCANEIPADGLGRLAAEVTKGFCEKLKCSTVYSWLVDHGDVGISPGVLSAVVFSASYKTDSFMHMQSLVEQETANCHISVSEIL